ncbi:DUF4760 domain-containing protein [Aliarcobacter butzleri]|uniref:DUF4760 domain-containing protein n=1 Tax=Aliarcobacter butzleri TaxID=28197 RepID=UPI003AF98520
MPKYKIICLIIGITLIISSIYFIIHFDIAGIELFKVVLGIFTGLGVILAFYQLKATHEWNRRNAALIEAEKNKGNMITAIRELDASSLPFTEKAGSYSLEEIHNVLCGNNNHSQNPPITDDGKKIKQNIFAILNYYEFLAIGVSNGIFDEEVIKSLWKGGMKKTYIIYSEYIKHLREKHLKNPKLAINFENLINSWENNPTNKKRGNTD